MTHRLILLIFATCPLAAWTEEPCDNETGDEIIIEKRVWVETMPLDHPVLHWEVVRVPSTGIVQRLAGTVEQLVPEKGWVRIEDGESLPITSKLWVHADASMVVRFSEAEYIEFNAAPEDRWVQFDALQRP